MSKIKTDQELIQHKQQAFNKLENYLTSLIQSKNSDNKSKADKILYWIETYTTFLDYEKKF